MPARARKSEDPFSDSNKENDVAETTNTEARGSELSLTFKGSGKTDGAWTGVRGSLDEVVATLNDDRFPDLLVKVAKVQRYNLQQTAELSPPAEETTASSSSTQASSSAVKCKHGDMVYRSGAKNGRTWQAYFCPSPKGTPDQCEAQFIR